MSRQFRFTPSGIPTQPPYSDLLRAGVLPKITSERLGRALIAVPMDIYSHAIPGLQEDAAHRIDATLRSALAKHLGGESSADEIADRVKALIKKALPG